MVRSRSRHTRATISEVAEQPAPAEGYPDNYPRKTIDLWGNTTSVFDSLGRPKIYHCLGREPSADKEENHDQSRLDRLQWQLD